MMRRINHLSENGVGTIEPRSSDGRDEELAAVGVLAGVGHTQKARA